MKAIWTCGCLLVALVLVLNAKAGDDGKKTKGDFETFFKKLDTNTDGKLSKDEFLKMADRAKEKDQARQKLSQAYAKLDPAMMGITKEIFKRYLEDRKKEK